MRVVDKQRCKRDVNENLHLSVTASSLPETIRFEVTFDAAERNGRFGRIQCQKSKEQQQQRKEKEVFFYLPYLSSIHEKAMYYYAFDGKSALAWELLFPGHLSST